MLLYKGFELPQSYGEIVLRHNDMKDKNEVYVSICTENSGICLVTNIPNSYLLSPEFGMSELVEKLKKKVDAFYDPASSNFS